MILTDLYLINIRSIISGNKILKFSLANKKLFSKKLYSFQENLKRNNSTRMSNKHLIAICQITCIADKQENYNICKNLITSAVRDGAKMVFLPEACDYIESSSKASLEKAESIDGELISNYRKLASELNVWISIGSFHRKVETNQTSKMYNSHVILDNKGEIRCINDKIHLFESNIKHGESYVTLKESDYTEPGSQFHLPLESPIGLLATPICYDLRFPVLSSLLRKLGAQIITYPSVFTEPTGQAHWEVLLRARAIENQCYVVAAAQVGKHNEKRSSYGYSMVVDPWGKIIANCEKESPSYRLAEIDLDYLNEVRNSIPILNSHRHDLYIQMPIVIKNIDSEFYTFSDKIKLSNNVVFLETLHCIAFVNIKPIVKGHVMVIPKQIRTRVEEMTRDEAIDLFNTARLVSARLEKHLDASSLNFGIQDGPDSGQSVKHVHLHILPRRKGDMKRDDEIYEKLQSHDKDMTTGLRTPEQMADEAAEFRKLFY